MPHNPSIIAILVAHNSADVIAAAIASVANHPAVARVIVVDNASTDGTATLLRERFPQVELIESAENLGFGQGNNLALERVATPFALLLNPDAVLRPGALDALLAAAEIFSDAMIVAPQLEDEQGVPYASIKRDVFAREAARGRFIPPEGPCCAPFVSGAVWLLRREALRESGFFDANIFLYYEDDDLCLRVRALGGSCVLVPAASATHGLGKSSALGAEGTRFRHRHMAWSRLYLERKYRGEQAARLLRRSMRMRAWLRRLFYLLTCNRRKAAKYAGQLQGIAQFT